MYLKPGDLVALISPSRAISAEEVKASVAFLESQGLKVVIGEHAYDVDRQFAGTDAHKIKDIQGFLDNKEVKAIWSTRGGYGGARIIDGLDFSGLQASFKWLVGYSDFTVFHSHLNAQSIGPSLHATMPVNISSSPNENEYLSNQSMLDALFGRDMQYDLAGHKLNKEGNANGVLVGGNLSILYSLCGSPSDIQTEGKILFMEDLDEYLYHIDRMMMNLKRTGKLHNLAGLVVGGMSDMNDNAIPYGATAEEIILSHTKEYNYPVYFGLQSGHIQPNLALRLGLKAKIEDNHLILQA